jgi:hypothetical protein
MARKRERAKACLMGNRLSRLNSSLTMVKAVKAVMAPEKIYPFHYPSK